MTWIIESIDREREQLNLTDQDHSHVSVEYWLLPDGIEPGDDVDIWWQSGQKNGVGWGERVRRVDWRGVSLVDMSDQYLKDRHEKMVAEIRMKNERRAFVNREDVERRIKNLLPPLRNRLERFLEEDPDFAKQSMGLEYELFICEQAQVLYNVSNDIEWLEAMRDEFGISPTPNNALDEWWSLNSQKHNYNYQRQYELVPGWENGHSGMTASAAYQFAKLLNKGEGDRL